MKLTIEEGNYLETLLKRTKKLYGNHWETMLEKTSVTLPEKGLNQREDLLPEFDPGKEEEVIEQLKKKNIVTIRKEETEIPEEGEFKEKYSDSSDMFIGINPGKLQELKKQLNIEEQNNQ